ncbi:response regulator [Vibrio sp. TH_r3]|uniref:response regulator n=1 Tax=Vibrio sp. TH_r3 TaxID=3082084 RepID=UPI0029554AF9|nr:response regulator [Vibrio sp. TH_r3]MDV7103159.1 response regulator [Vibrio sp. TH_r3]
MNSHADCTLKKQQRGLNSRTIMLVDDDPIFRRFTSVLLEKQGYSVIEAEHGLDGLQKLRKSIPDLIISDISMPILNGIEFAEEVCSQYPNVPMIVVSASNEMSDVARVLRFGIKDFLTKPISVPTHLLSAISSILDQPCTQTSRRRDFSSQWFRIGEHGNVPEDKELYWHLDYLKDNPEAARQLLTALLPCRDTNQGGWVCSYNLLQASDKMPLIFDYTWLMNGQFAFYLVDSTTAKDSSTGVACSLLIRALFNDGLIRKTLNKPSLVGFVNHLHHGLECLDGNASVAALFGIVDTSDRSVSIVPAGLEAIWTQGHDTIHIDANHFLGSESLDDILPTSLNMTSCAKLNIANIGVSYFNLDIKRK